MAYLCSQMSKIITFYPLWRWFISSSLQHQVSWVEIRWRIIDFFKVLHLHWGAPSCQSTVHVMTSVQHWAHSMFMFLTGSPPCLTHDEVWFRSSVFPFRLQKSPSFWYRLFFCPNMISDVCAKYCNPEIINKSQEDCKSVNLQRNYFLSMC